MTLHSAPLALIGCVLVSACAPSLAQPRLLPVTPTEQFAVQVQPSADEIQLAPHGGLSPTQHSALSALVMRWREVGEGPLVIQSAPGGLGSDTAQSAAGALQGLGVPPASIRLSQVEGEPQTPVRVGFKRYVAVTPRCADQWGNLVRTAFNETHAAFGCSVTANMAAQLADPRDLVAPQPATPADSRRRVLKSNSYHAGEEPKKEQ